MASPLEISPNVISIICIVSNISKPNFPTVSLLLTFSFHLPLDLISVCITASTLGSHFLRIYPRYLGGGLAAQPCQTATMLLSLLPVSLLLAIASAKQYNVTVGKGGLKFDPEIITGAQKGDTIRYSFFAANHSVVESNFADPCVPLNGGAFSGFVPTASPDKASATTFTIELNDTKPRWIYCSQGAHCKSGMVHSIK